jgi:hypothetical protein
VSGLRAYLVALVVALAVPAVVALAAACERAGESGAAAPEAAVTEIASPAAPVSGEPHLSTAGSRVYLSWIESAPDSAHALRFAVLDGEAWSAPRTVAQGRGWFVNWADFPSLVELPDGTLAAHWLVKSASQTYAYDVHLAFSRDGGATWSEPVIPHRDGTPTEHGFVSLFPAPGGDLGAVWLDGRKFADVPPDPDGEHGLEAEMTLRYAAVDPAGALRDTTLLDDRTCDCCQTAAATTSAGPIVAYRDRSPDEVRDIVVTRRLGAAWTEPAAVHEDGWVIPACPVNGPAIDAQGDRVAVAWFTAARDTARVRLAFSDDAGASWSAPIPVDDGNPAGRVDVTLLDDGSALVVWLERQEDRAAVRARRVGRDGEAGRSITVATSSEERASGFPHVALSGDRAIFAWTDPTEPARVRTAAIPLAAWR